MRKNLKRILSSVLTLVLAFGVFANVPFAAYADGSSVQFTAATDGSAYVPEQYAKNVNFINENGEAVADDYAPIPDGTNGTNPDPFGTKKAKLTAVTNGDYQADLQLVNVDDDALKKLSYVVPKAYEIEKSDGMSVSYTNNCLNDHEIIDYGGNKQSFSSITTASVAAKTNRDLEAVKNNSYDLKVTMTLDAKYSINSFLEYGHCYATSNMMTYAVFVGNDKDNLYTKENQVCLFSYDYTYVKDNNQKGKFNGYYSTTPRTATDNANFLSEGGIWNFTGDTRPVGQYIGLKIYDAGIHAGTWYLYEIAVTGSKVVTDPAEAVKTTLSTTNNNSVGYYGEAPKSADVSITSGGAAVDILVAGQGYTFTAPEPKEDQTFEGWYALGRCLSTESVATFEYPGVQLEARYKTGLIFLADFVNDKTLKWAGLNGTLKCENTDDGMLITKKDESHESTAATVTLTHGDAVMIADHAGTQYDPWATYKYTLKAEVDLSEAYKPVDKETNTLFQLNTSVSTLINVKSYTKNTTDKFDIDYSICFNSGLTLTDRDKPVSTKYVTGQILNISWLAPGAKLLLKSMKIEKLNNVTLSVDGGVTSNSLTSENIFNFKSSASTDLASYNPKTEKYGENKISAANAAGQYIMDALSSRGVVGAVGNGKDLKINCTIANADTKIDTVEVNGVAVSDFTYAGNVLTIPGKYVKGVKSTFEPITGTYSDGTGTFSYDLNSSDIVDVKITTKSTQDIADVVSKTLETTSSKATVYFGDVPEGDIVVTDDNGKVTEVESGKTYTFAAPVPKDGQYFDGWYNGNGQLLGTDLSSDIEYSGGQVIAKYKNNIIFFADFKGNNGKFTAELSGTADASRYTVSFLNDGTLNIKNNTESALGSALLTPSYANKSMRDTVFEPWTTYKYTVKASTTGTAQFTSFPNTLADKINVKGDMKEYSEYFNSGNADSDYGAGRGTYKILGQIVNPNTVAAGNEIHIEYIKIEKVNNIDFDCDSESITVSDENLIGYANSTSDIKDSGAYFGDNNLKSVDKIAPKMKAEMQAAGHKYAALEGKDLTLNVNLAQSETITSFKVNGEDFTYEIVNNKITIPGSLIKGILSTDALSGEGPDGSYNHQLNSNKVSIAITTENKFDVKDVIKSELVSTNKNPTYYVGDAPTVVNAAFETDGTTPVSEFVEGQTYKIKAPAPLDGQEFIGWYKDGELLSSDAETVVEVDGKNIVAKYQTNVIFLADFKLGSERVTFTHNWKDYTIEYTDEGIKITADKNLGSALISTLKIDGKNLLDTQYDPWTTYKFTFRVKGSSKSDVDINILPTANSLASGNSRALPGEPDEFGEYTYYFNSGKADYGSGNLTTKFVSSSTINGQIKSGNWIVIDYIKIEKANNVVLDDENNAVEENTFNADSKHQRRQEINEYSFRRVLQGVDEQYGDGTDFTDNAGTEIDTEPKINSNDEMCRYTGEINEWITNKFNEKKIGGFVVDGENFSFDFRLKEGYNLDAVKINGTALPKNATVPKDPDDQSMGWYTCTVPAAEVVGIASKITPITFGENEPYGEYDLTASNMIKVEIEANNDHTVQFAVENVIFKTVKVADGEKAVLKKDEVPVFAGKEISAWQFDEQGNCTIPDALNVTTDITVHILICNMEASGLSYSFIDVNGTGHTADNLYYDQRIDLNSGADNDKVKYVDNDENIIGYGQKLRLYYYKGLSEVTAVAMKETEEKTPVISVLAKEYSNNSFRVITHIDTAGAVVEEAGVIFVSDTGSYDENTFTFEWLNENSKKYKTAVFDSTKWSDYIGNLYNVKDTAKRAARAYLKLSDDIYVYSKIVYKDDDN